ALFTSTSSVTFCRVSSSTISREALGCDRSLGSTRTSILNRPRSSAASCSSASTLRALMTRSNPCSAKTAARSLPMPAEAPVISAICRSDMQETLLAAAQPVDKLIDQPLDLRQRLLGCRLIHVVNVPELDAIDPAGKMCLQQRAMLDFLKRDDQ